MAKYTAPKEFLEEMIGDAPPEDEYTNVHTRVILKKEDDYRKQRLDRQLSPGRSDPFAKKSSTDPSESEKRSYSQILREVQVDREISELNRLKEQREKEEKRQEFLLSTVEPKKENKDSEPRKRRKRWDTIPSFSDDKQAEVATKPKISEWESEDIPVKKSKWDETPAKWDEQTPSQKKKSRWDETPVSIPVTNTVQRTGPRWGETPSYEGIAQELNATPVAGYGTVTPHLLLKQAGAMTSDLAERNRVLTDQELDDILPKEGYKLLPPPASYKPIHTPARKLMATPAPMTQEGFFMQQEGVQHSQIMEIQRDIPATEELPMFKPEDVTFFGKLLDNKAPEDMNMDEARLRKIMRLIIRIKNGTPQMRKVSMKEIAEKARYFGPAALFDQILPLLMSPALEDQERHLLVKVIDRILFKLDDLVRPYVHKILVVIEPLLIDEDYYARVEGREIISNLSKAAGLATMISAMRPDLDHNDEYVRNTTARAFSVVASALGIPAIVPFLKAVCKSKKSWQARHTGIKIVQQIAILLGCGVLPHLKQLVLVIADGLLDEQQKVRTITALAIGALAEAASPYGIESFDPVLIEIWHRVQDTRGKGLAALLKAIGFIVPLMDPDNAGKYTKTMMKILIREFASPDEEMKKIVLKVVRQLAATDGVEAAYLRSDVLPEFYRNYWVRRMALDRRNYAHLVETTVELANKVGVTDAIGRIVGDLKDESEPFRKMVAETIQKIVENLGTSDIDESMEEKLIDGLLYAFQEQVLDDIVVLNSFGVIMNALGLRVKPYLPQICSSILWRLNNKCAKIRQQAADLVARVAMVMNTCGEEKLLGHLGMVLYEYLGEEYPDVLGSILGGLKGIINVIGMSKMTPPIKDLLPRLTPILKNRHEKVQENCIDLVGRIADRGAEFVSAREWMRICFELLEMLKAHKKAIRRAAVNTFGYIAKAIGPQDVLSTLLNNLKVQERQNRVCTTVAIAIVAETCSPFTVLPALMNEYRVPEQNVQNGVLKSLSFMFEYIGEMGRDYIYAVTPLLEDALIDRDMVHRQTACTTVKHLSLGCFGLGCDDALIHLLNLVWPNVFETSPHVIGAVLEAVNGLRVSLGAGTILMYLLQGLYHPARKVREVYWKIYNQTYIGAQDSLVAFYPRIDDDEEHCYERWELDYVL